jgi:hypothetical protein
VEHENDKPALWLSCAVAVTAGRFSVARVSRAGASDVPGGAATRRSSAYKTTSPSGSSSFGFPAAMADGRSGGRTPSSSRGCTGPVTWPSCRCAASLKVGGRESRGARDFVVLGINACRAPLCLRAAQSLSW